MSENLPFDAEAIAGKLAPVATAQGNTASVAALAVSVPRLARTGYDNWNGGTDILTLYLEVPTQLFAQLLRMREDVQECLLTMLQPIIESYAGYWTSAVAIVPAKKYLQLAPTGNSLAGNALATQPGPGTV